MGRYFYSEAHIKSPWYQVLAAFWQRYPNPYSTHVLTEDVLYREVTPTNLLLSRRLLTKTNRLPGWAEHIFPAHMARGVYILEDSIVDPEANTLVTKTWNLNHNTLMTVVERCMFEQDGTQPTWTKLKREAWIFSSVYGLARPIQSFPISMATRKSHPGNTSPAHQKPRPLQPRSPISSPEPVTASKQKLLF
uniref:PRELI/MSF1 domain-containing protein n=1 Tax=Poecilia mexicana TaxID=48701 RepID=A0A3B3XIE7_9TELE